MRTSIFFGLSFVASALAVAVTSPVNGDVWGTAIPSYTVSWTSVSSDPSTLSVYLVNPSGSVDDELVAQANTAAGSVTVNAPSGGWPVGSQWRINLMNIPTTGSAGILAQSGTFNITSGNGGTSTGSVAAPTTMSVMTTAVVAATTATTANTVATTSGTDTSILNPTSTGGKNGALSLFQVSGTLLGLVAFVHAMVL
jgi:hypothetical protein